MIRIGIISQARMGSTRLPGKVLLPAGGKTMLAWHLQRLQKSGFPIVVATTAKAEDDPVAEAAVLEGIDVFRGDEQNVLNRYLGAAEQGGFDVIVRVTSDCPLIDGHLIRKGVEMFVDLGDTSAFVSNTLKRTYPRGIDFEVFSMEALREADAMATQQVEREHVTPYFYSTTAADRRIVQVVRDQDASVYRITLDTPEDYQVLNSLIVEQGAGSLDCEELITLLESQPGLTFANHAIAQKTLGE